MPEVLQAKYPLCCVISDVLVNYRHLNNRKIVRNFSWQYLDVKISDKRMFDYMTVENIFVAFLMPKFGTGCPSTTRQRQRQKQRQRKRPRGLMHKASDFESEDWGFESLRGRIFANIPIGRIARSVASEIASMLRDRKSTRLTPR